MRPDLLYLWVGWQARSCRHDWWSAHQRVGRGPKVKFFLCQNDWSIRIFEKKLIFSPMRVSMYIIREYTLSRKSRWRWWLQSTHQNMVLWKHSTMVQYSSWLRWKSTMTCDVMVSNCACGSSCRSHKEGTYPPWVFQMQLINFYHLRIFFCLMIDRRSYWKVSVCLRLVRTTAVLLTIRKNVCGWTSHAFGCSE